MEQTRICEKEFGSPRSAIHLARNYQVLPFLTSRSNFGDARMAKSQYLLMRRSYSCLCSSVTFPPIFPATEPWSLGQLRKKEGNYHYQGTRDKKKGLIHIMLASNLLDIYNRICQWVWDWKSGTYTEKNGTRRVNWIRLQALDIDFAQTTENATSSRRVVATIHRESRNIDWLGEPVHSRGQCSIWQEIANKQSDCSDTPRLLQNYWRHWSLPGQQRFIKSPMGNDSVHWQTCWQHILESLYKLQVENREELKNMLQGQAQEKTFGDKKIIADWSWWP